MGAMQHLVFFIFSLIIAFSHIADSHSITELLEKGGLTTFSTLIQKTGVVDAYNSALDKKGLTILAPSNEAFASPPIQEALKKLTPDQVVTLLKYHAMGEYTIFGTQEAITGPIDTLATDGVGTYTVEAANLEDKTIVIAGVGLSQIVETIANNKPLVIYKITNVLKPKEIFGK